MGLAEALLPAEGWRPAAARILYRSAGAGIDLPRSRIGGPIAPGTRGALSGKARQWVP